MSLLRGQSLTLALVAAALLAYLFPHLGAAGGPLRPEIATPLAVAAIFLMQGLSLPTRQLLRSAGNVRLHAFCIASNFLIAPLFMLGLIALGQDWIDPQIRDGLLFLAFLPTTISSAVVMTGNSRGDVSSALFSTTLSNILGVFLTPLLCILLLDTMSAAPVSIAPTLRKLSWLVLLPLALGQVLRPLARARLLKAATAFRRVSVSLIVFIVFAALCQSMLNGVWSELGPLGNLQAAAATVVFLLLFSYATWQWSALASPRPDQRVAAFFCGSQKTLAAGVPMATVLFSDNSHSLGLLLLPLLVFHPLQLIFGALITPALSRHVEKGGNQSPESECQ